jgi:hypothetical protein
VDHQAWNVFAPRMRQGFPEALHDPIRTAAHPQTPAFQYRSIASVTVLNPEISAAVKFARSPLLNSARR